jgi:hypothetical protein
MRLESSVSSTASAFSAGAKCVSTCVALVGDRRRGWASRCRGRRRTATRRSVSAKANALARARGEPGEVGTGPVEVRRMCPQGPRAPSAVEAERWTATRIWEWEDAEHAENQRRDHDVRCGVHVEGVDVASGARARDVPTAVLHRGVRRTEEIRCVFDSGSSGGRREDTRGQEAEPRGVGEVASHLASSRAGTGLVPLSTTIAHRYW